MLESVKKALRISHSVLDDDIKENIEAAKAELIRAGCDPELVTAGEDALVLRAVKTYCLEHFCDDMAKAEKYHTSFELQLDSMRKSANYKAV